MIRYHNSDQNNNLLDIIAKKLYSNGYKEARVEALPSFLSVGGIELRIDYNRMHYTYNIESDMLVVINNNDIVKQCVVDLIIRDSTCYFKTKSALDSLTTNKKVLNLTIKRVIFNDPATIILWSDGTKTVVKAQDGEYYDPEKGLAMAIAKKVLGNRGNYYELFKNILDDCNAQSTDSGLKEFLLKCFTQVK